MAGGDFQPTQPAPLSALTGQAIDEFRVGHPAEVIGLLRQLADRSVLVQLCAPGDASYTTVVWAVDAQARRIRFDADAAHPQIRALIDAGEATAVAYVDAIKLQFDVQGLMLVHGNNASTLQANLPQALYRFQRREYFRVRTRDSAQAQLQHPALPEMGLTLRVVDVSAGGCALALPADVPPLAAGIDIAGVRLDLDPNTRLVVTLHIEHVSGGFHPGARGTRLGCSFKSLAGEAQRVLQQYIDASQRRSKFLSIG
jgi:c-di-GMP-binding flagellar brake protein YcgR